MCKELYIMELSMPEISHQHWLIFVMQTGLGVKMTAEALQAMHLALEVEFFHGLL